MLGETVAGYRIVSRLGEGGMGEVYVAEHTRIDRRVAIKVIRPELSSRSDMVARFFAEARATSSIRHPGIVQIFDSDMELGGRAFIVMELLEGESLLARMRREPSFGRDESTAVDLAAEIADALAAAHAKSIVHRDLKPDNVFLARDHRASERYIVKILDFGIAKLLTAGDDLGAMVRTRTGAMLGTPVYMSPEQCRGTGVVDGRADIYALGCILFELLTGRPPFIYAGFGELIAAHLSETPMPTRRLAPHVSTSLEALVARLLEKDPDRRLPSMDEVRDQLRTPSRRGAEPARAPAGPPPRQSPRLDADSPRARDAGPHPVAKTRGTLIAPPSRPSHTTLSEMAAEGTLTGRAAASGKRRRRATALAALGLIVGAAAFLVLRAPTLDRAPPRTAGAAANVPAAPAATAPATSPSPSPASSAVPTLAIEVADAAVPPPEAPASAPATGPAARLDRRAVPAPAAAPARATPATKRRRSRPDAPAAPLDLDDDERKL